MTAVGRRLRWTLTCLYVVMLATGSLLPSGADAPGGWDQSITPTAQNAMHAPAYAVLVILLVMAIQTPGKHIGPGLAMLAGAGCSAYGAFLECLQTVVPGRTGSAYDALLNAVGIAAGLGLMAAVRLTHRPRHKLGTSQTAPLPGEQAEGEKLNV